MENIRDKVSIEEDSSITGSILRRQQVHFVDPLTFIGQDTRAFIRTLVSRPLKVQFKTHQDAWVGATDGKTIWLDGNIAQDESIPLPQRADIIKGICLDEAGHCLWTTLTKAQCVRYYERHMNPALPYAPKAFAGIVNLLEDHYNVSRLLRKFPGFVQLHFATVSHYFNVEERIAQYRSEIAEQGVPKFKSVVAMLVICVKGHIRLKGADGLNRMADRFDEVHTLNKHEDRVALALEIFEELVQEYVTNPKDMAEDTSQPQEQEQEQEQPQAQAQAQENESESESESEPSPQGMEDLDNESDEAENDSPSFEEMPEQPLGDEADEEGFGGEDEDEDWDEDEDESDEDESDEDSENDLSWGEDEDGDDWDEDEGIEGGEEDSETTSFDSDEDSESDESSELENDPSASESGEGEDESDEGEEVDESGSGEENDVSSDAEKGESVGANDSEYKPTYKDIEDEDYDLDALTQNAGVGDVTAMNDADPIREDDSPEQEIRLKERILGSDVTVVRNPDPVNSKGKTMPKWDRQVANQMKAKLQLTGTDEGGWTHGYRSGQILPRDVVKVAMGSRTPASRYNSRTMPHLSVALVQDASGSISDEDHAVICRICDIVIDAMEKANKGLKVWHMAYKGSWRTELIVSKEPGKVRKVSSRQASNPGGGTPTVEAITKVTQMMNEADATARKLIVLLTDGGPNNVTLPNGESVRGNTAIHAFNQENRDVEVMQILINSNSGADVQHTVKIKTLDDSTIARLVATLNAAIKTTRRQRQ